MAQLRDTVGNPQPACGTVALVRQPDAACVDEPHLAYHPVVLLVGVAGDDERGVDPSEGVRPPLTLSNFALAVATASGRATPSTTNL